MKKIESTQKPNFLKKLFIKLCRLIGYEIIDGGARIKLHITHSTQYVLDCTRVVLFVPYRCTHTHRYQVPGYPQIYFLKNLR